MSKNITHAEIRSEMIDEFKKFMMGPHWGNDEAINMHPKLTYMLGMLYPQNSEVEQENVTNEINEAGNAEPPEKIVLNSLNTSSFGLTCMLDHSTRQIIVKVEYGIYLSVDREKKRFTYQRHHFEETFDVPTSADFENPLKIPFGSIRINFDETEAGIVCNVDMINTDKVADSSKSDNIMFQPRIEICAGKDQIIDNKGDYSRLPRALDDRLFDLIFADKYNFGYGHGCAVSWDDAEITEKRIGRIWTDFIPEYEQDKILHADATKDLMSCVDMKKLASITDIALYSKALSVLPDAYEKWIGEKLRGRITHVENREVAKFQIEQCDDALHRMKEGIAIVSSDPIAGKAFQFMNEVMAIQRTCSITASKNTECGKFDPPVIDKASGQWRLFQMAFILMNVKSFLPEKNNAKNLDGADISEEDIRKSRESADLLWFPTGGGKTEAYLGIIAFSIAVRRLSAPKSRSYPNTQAYGVSVLMRYTLRLLTIQQFQRAATLMCACEYVRRKDPETWGSMQFLVGLWVGRAATPNSLRMTNDERGSAETAILNSRQTKKIPDNHNPMQLLNCPWCGSPMDASCYEVYPDEKFSLPERLRAYCPNRHCFFHKNNLSHEGNDVCIPILTVDEDIYRWCPSLLISTVDKFAQITWNDKIASLFGYVNKFCNTHGFFDNKKTGDHKSSGSSAHQYFTIGRLTPPDMIVQDELHLISGPLGTLTALYETAIDYFCRNRRRNMVPKIIASTATTKSAGSQITSLFNRSDTNIFPPQGFEFGKTYFSRIDTDATGKIFLGISPTARSQLTILAMSAASFMRKIRKMKDDGMDEKLLDPYYTLVSYFNSRRELGGAYGTFADTIPDYFKQIIGNIENREDANTASTVSTQNMTRSKDDKRKYYKAHFNSDELTSRKNSGEIPDILRRLSKPLPDAFDYLLCTNMLSVGVDIQRLGLMIVNGQPKNHSEYIQATGRIGRQYPGLILTIYNPLKPRDLSHFENFRVYHSRFFKYVEPISITPFAPRARDRGLFAVCVGMLRNLVPLVAHDPKQFGRGPEEIRNFIEEIKNEFSKRIDRIDNEQLKSTLEEIDDYLDAWENRANSSSSRSFRYRATSYTKKQERDTTDYLLTAVEEGNATLSGIPQCPMSLRDAEQMHDVYFYEQQVLDMGDGHEE